MIQRPIFKPLYFYNVFLKILKNTSFSAPSKNTRISYVTTMVLVHSKGLLQHLAHLEELFKRFHEVNMKIHLKKCEFAITSIIYLGHKILPNGIMVHWAKILAILEMPNLIDVHTLKSFIKLCNYYKIYVQDFSTIAHHVYALLKKDVAWTWNEEA